MRSQLLLLHGWTSRMPITSLSPFLPDQNGVASTRPAGKHLPRPSLALEHSDTSTSESSSDDRSCLFAVVTHSSKTRRMSRSPHHKTVQVFYRKDPTNSTSSFNSPSHVHNQAPAHRGHGPPRVSSPSSRKAMPPPPKLIPSLRHEIDDIDSQMASLMNRRARLGSRLEQVARLQCPISRLPGEILSSIFIISVLCKDDEGPMPVSTLMLVCRFWASVAVATPALWESISVTGADSHERAKRRLVRSKSVLLTLSVDFTSQTQTSGLSTQDIVRSMDVVRVAIPRTRTLNFHLSSRAQAHTVFQLCQVPAAALEALSIHVEVSLEHLEREPRLHSSSVARLFSGHTPRLSSCSLLAFDIGWAFPSLIHLRVLRLGGYWNSQSPAYSALFDLLKQNLPLQEVHLKGISDINDAASPERRSSASYIGNRSQFCLPNLTKASFYNSGACRLRSILGQISTPALGNLALGFLGDITPLLYAMVHLPLRRLRVEACSVDRSKFCATLLRIPTLSMLELVDLDDVAPELIGVGYAIVALSSFD